MKITAERAFLAFTISWVAYDASARLLTGRDDQMLTDAARRLQKRHPLLWPIAVGITSMHLTGEFERLGIAHLDPYTRAAQATRWVFTRICRPRR